MPQGRTVRSNADLFALATAAALLTGVIVLFLSVRSHDAAPALPTGGGLGGLARGALQIAAVPHAPDPAANDGDVNAPLALAPVVAPAASVLAPAPAVPSQPGRERSHRDPRRDATVSSGQGHSRGDPTGRPRRGSDTRGSDVTRTKAGGPQTSLASTGTDSAPAPAPAGPGAGGMPPGLAKRGGDLPPGLAKRGGHLPRGLAHGHRH
jgi:hypothetical protein